MKRFTAVLAFFLIVSSAHAANEVRVEIHYDNLTVDVFFYDENEPIAITNITNAVHRQLSCRSLVNPIGGGEAGISHRPTRPERRAPPRALTPLLLLR